MAIDNDKRQFEQRWQESVKKTAELARWKPNLLGPAIRDYRETPSKSEIDDLLGYLENILMVEARGYGLSEADFWRDVKKYAAKEAEYAVRNDQTELYKQAEAEAEARRPDTARTEQHKIHKIFRNCLRRIGWLPVGTRGKFKEQDVKQLGKEMSAQDFSDLVDSIQWHNTNIARMDQELARLADKISGLEADLVMEPDELERERIRNNIARERETVRNQALTRVQNVELVQEEEKKQNLLMTLIRAELEAEGKKMERKWGRDIDNNANKRQTLVQALDNATRGNDVAYQTKLRTEIRDIDLELHRLTKEVTQYITERPIFLFERFVGVGSIPILNRLGQASSIIAGAELPDVDRPGPKIPYKS